MRAFFDRALSKVRENIINGRLLCKGDRVLCALSGGADSVSLLVFLKALEKELGITVCAAHLNHGIRGNEADRDEEYCKALCFEYEVPFVSERADVPAEAERTGMGLEECARHIRYEFLRRAAKQLGCRKICTAHHADDNIETVLLHMIRGCGLAGLSGIAPVREDIVRPMLSLRKSELVCALDEKGIKYVHDSTNDETDCARNYIRHNILPHIYELNPSADKAFLRMCESTKKDSDFLWSEAKKVPLDASSAILAKLPKPILVRFLQNKFAHTAGYAARLDNFAVSVIVNALKNGDIPTKYDVNNGFTVYIDSHGVSFERKDKENVGDYLVPLSMGENIISKIGYKIFITTDKKVALEWKNIYKLSTLWSVSFDKISVDGVLSVVVRNRRSGDRYTFGKMSRDVRRQLINYKIPMQKRDSLPCFCSSDELFAVYGLPIADGFKASKDEKTAYIVCAEEN